MGWCAGVVAGNGHRARRHARKRAAWSEALAIFFHRQKRSTSLPEILANGSSCCLFIIMDPNRLCNLGPPSQSTAADSCQVGPSPAGLERGKSTQEKRLADAKSRPPPTTTPLYLPNPLVSLQSQWYVASVLFSDAPATQLTLLTRCARRVADRRSRKTCRLPLDLLCYEPVCEPTVPRSCQCRTYSSFRSVSRIHYVIGSSAAGLGTGTGSGPGRGWTDDDGRHQTTRPRRSTRTTCG
jgi:hypothetical protein